MATPAMSSNQGSGTMRYVPLNSVIESKTNPRKHFDKKALHELALSIAEKGVLVPLLVRVAKGFDASEPESQLYYEIVAGARRYRAAKEAGTDQVPVIVRELDDLQALEVQVIENLQRRDVHPLEEAEGYKQLLAAGKYKDVDALAAKVGKSVSYVYQRLKLAELLPDAQKKFLEEKITAGHAILIARLQPKDQKRALKRMFDYHDESCSVRELAKWIERDVHLVLSNAPFPLDDTGGIKSAGLVKGSVACIDCPKRSGANPQLFEDIDSKDVCTDPTCYHAKEQKFVKLQLYTNPGSRSLSAGNFYGAKPEGLTDWTPAGKKKCRDTVEGVVVELSNYFKGDEKLGQLLNVCTNGRCKVHHSQASRSSSLGYVATGETAAQKAKRKADELKRELQGQADRKALDLLLDKMKEPTRREMEIIAASMYMGLNSESSVNKRFGWTTGLSYVNAPKAIAKLTDAQLNQLLIAVAYDAVAYDGASYYACDKTTGEIFAAQCAKYKIDRKSMFDELAKSHASAKPGACRICGCTEKRACRYMTQSGKVPVSCSWTDATKTLCNNPKCVKAAAKAKVA